MSLHEKNATLLAQAIKETDADHIFIGDTDHKYANELLRTFCQRSLLAELQKSKIKVLCIESQPKTARTITRSAKRFQKKTFSEIKEEIDKLVLVGKIDQSTAALLMLSAHCQKINVGVNGVDIDTDQVQKEYGLGDDENPIEKLAFPELQRVAEATNQLTSSGVLLTLNGHFDLAAKRDQVLISVGKACKPFTLETLHLIAADHRSRMGDTVLLDRFAKDPEIARRITEKEGKGKRTCTIYGAAHRGIPANLDGGCLRINFCYSSQPLVNNRMILEDYLKGNCADQYLLADRGMLASGQDIMNHVRAVIGNAIEYGFLGMK